MCPKFRENNARDWIVESPTCIITINSVFNFRFILGLFFFSGSYFLFPQFFVIPTFQYKRKRQKETREEKKDGRPPPSEIQFPPQIHSSEGRKERKNPQFLASGGIRPSSEWTRLFFFVFAGASFFFFLRTHVISFWSLSLETRRLQHTVKW